MTHFLLLTTNRSGVLSRITSVVSSTGTNIEAATAYPISGFDLSVVYLRVSASDVVTDRLRRKLMRLIDVIKVRTDVAQNDLSFDMGRAMSTPDSAFLNVGATV